MIRPSRRPAPDPDEQIARMERIVRERVDSGRSAGIAAGMVFADGEARRGRLRRRGGGPARGRGRSVFEIGSIAKGSRERCWRGDGAAGRGGALTDPVASLLPPGVTVPSRGGRQITLLDLATQTSGLPRLPTNLAVADESDPYVDYSVEEMYAFLGGCALTRDPGAKYEYSNLGRRAAGARRSPCGRTRATRGSCASASWSRWG